MSSIPEKPLSASTSTLTTTIAPAPSAPTLTEKRSFFLRTSSFQKLKCTATYPFRIPGTRLNKDAIKELIETLIKKSRISLQIVFAVSFIMILKLFNSIISLLVSVPAKNENDCDNKKNQNTSNSNNTIRTENVSSTFKVSGTSSKLLGFRERLLLKINKLQKHKQRLSIKCKDLSSTKSSSSILISSSVSLTSSSTSTSTSPSSTAINSIGSTVSSVQSSTSNGINIKKSDFDETNQKLSTTKNFSLLSMTKIKDILLSTLCILSGLKSSNTILKLNLNKITPINRINSIEKINNKSNNNNKKLLTILVYTSTIFVYIQFTLILFAFITIQNMPPGLIFLLISLFGIGIILYKVFMFKKPTDTNVKKNSATLKTHRRSSSSERIKTTKRICNIPKLDFDSKTISKIKIL